MAESNFEDKQLDRLQRFIEQTWHTLSRGHRDLLRAAIDPKMVRQSDKWLVYVSAQENRVQVEQRLRMQMSPGEFAAIEVQTLPADSTELTEENHGLLYLPHPYIVPGGRFNEMYGWDGYFIVRGLVQQGEIALAKSMVENYLYQVMHYGKILNANRTYYLTRSQPPFLTSMILTVYAQTQDLAWLRKTIPAIEQYYRYWTEEPHLTPQTGLARYCDLGHGPAPEVLTSEQDSEGRTHYERVRAHYKAHPGVTHDYGYDISRFYDRQNDCLTDEFYLGDRSMRESGFDPSYRFGHFNVGIIDYNPVCLNSLLYVMESDTATIFDLLRDREQAAAWRHRATTREQQINRLMWHDDLGMYFDYNFVQETTRIYPFATTFYPLWAGIASEEQARRVVANLPLFEQPGGVQTSTVASGCQWDGSFGWAPLQLLAVEGLRRYGYEREASRISLNFLSLVLKEFAQYNAIFEKYDVAQRVSTFANLEYGYTSNEIGFGWTNGVFVELLAALPRLPLDGVGCPQREG